MLRDRPLNHEHQRPDAPLRLLSQRAEQNIPDFLIAAVEKIVVHALTTQLNQDCGHESRRRSKAAIDAARKLTKAVNYFVCWLLLAV